MALIDRTAGVRAGKFRVMRTWHIRWGLLPVAALVALIALLTLAGAFRPLDDALTDRRFLAETRPPTGDVVFHVYAGQACEGSTLIPDETVTLGADGTAESANFTAIADGIAATSA